MILSTSNFQRMFYVLITVVSVKDRKFREMKLFSLKTTFLTQKCKIAIIMCSGYVFAITV